MSHYFLISKTRLWKSSRLTFGTVSRHTGQHRSDPREETRPQNRASLPPCPAAEARHPAAGPPRGSRRAPGATRAGTGRAVTNAQSAFPTAAAAPYGAARPAVGCGSGRGGQPLRAAEPCPPTAPRPDPPLPFRGAVTAAKAVRRGGGAAIAEKA